MVSFLFPGPTCDPKQPAASFGWCFHFFPSIYCERVGTSNSSSDFDAEVCKLTTLEGRLKLLPRTREWLNLYRGNQNSFLKWNQLPNDQSMESQVSFQEYLFILQLQSRNSCSAPKCTGTRHPKAMCQTEPVDSLIFWQHVWRFIISGARMK